MPGGMKLTSLAVVLSLFLVAAVRAECPAGDLSGDCEIDFEDLEFLAEQWLDPNCEGADCADLDMVDGVNMADFALMGAHWAQIGTPLVINELMASNGRFMPDPQGEYDDWIELYNGAEQSVDVGGMYLTDDLDQPRMWRFPTDSPYSTTIASHGFLWVWTDGDSGDYGLHTNFELDADGDEIGLFDKDGSTLIDSVEFGGQTADISYGRYPDGSSQWRFLGLASPRAPNSEAYLGEVADCKFSHKGGFYSYNPRFEGPPLVTIACETEGATIYYTVDGSEPYEMSGRFPNGTIYSGPLSIAVRTCLRAKAIKPSWKPSATKTNTYFINETGPIRSLPAISLVGGATTTFYAPDGIMAYPTMRGMAYERPVSFEYTYPQDNSGFQIDCGLRVHGSDWMRPRYSYCPGPGVWEGNCKFSFRPYFRGMYGQSWLEYPIFPFEVRRFKSLVFRGGHNDRVNPFIKDELIRRLFADMGNVSSRGVMANLFMNGVYRGYYNPCEHIKEEFCQEWYGSDEEWDVMTMNGIRDGDSVSWNTMLSRVRNYDLSQPSNYAEATRHLDVASFADYLIIELWAGNWDWPQNNWAAASERSEEGKWRFFIWDAEGTMSSGQLYTVYFDRLNSQNNANGWLYRSLKSSQTFRHVFADRIYKHFYNDGAMTEANIQRRFYELKNMLYGVIPSMNMYVLNTWVPSRLSTFLNACIQEGVYTFNGPTLKINGSSQYGGPASVGDSLGMSDPQGSGTIYYTVDGSDPRESGAPVTTTVLAPYSAAKRVLVPTGPVHDNWRGGAAFDDLLWTPCS
ncbi:MAG: CotH kinase family protein, partial [Phycisphaerales bacterium]